MILIQFMFYTPLSKRTFINTIPLRAIEFVFKAFFYLILFKKETHLYNILIFILYYIMTAKKLYDPVVSTNPKKKYSEYDTNDKERRRLYYARFGRTTDKDTALYWASKILW